MSMSSIQRKTAATTSRPPFRADIVGSFLRPSRLKEARERLLGPQTPDQHLGPHDNADLREIEDESRILGIE
jgi:5-methyltetrahydropteroyltriglutamate--homocysteine methyltransferase